jgi:hypothetical protein
VLDTTYFFALSIVWAKGIIQSAIQSGAVPAAVCRHAASISLIVIQGGRVSGADNRACPLEGSVISEARYGVGRPS